MKKPSDVDDRWNDFVIGTSSAFLFLTVRTPKLSRWRTTSRQCVMSISVMPLATWILLTVGVLSPGPNFWARSFFSFVGVRGNSRRPAGG